MFLPLRTTLPFCLFPALTFLSSISLAEIPAADGEGPIPVIDIHTHVFNLHDLPLAGVLSARGAPDSVAKSLAKILNRWTEADDISKPIAKVNLFTADFLSLRDTVANKKGLNDLLTREERQELADYAGVISAPPPAPSPAASPSANIPRPLGIAPGTSAILPKFRSLTEESDPDVDMGIVAAALRKADFPPTENPSAPEPTNRLPLESAAFIGMDLSSAHLKGYVDFIGIMRKGHVAIAQRLMTEYKPIDLFVHHMMDMSKPYADDPVVPFDQQMKRMTTLDQRFPGQFIHFVAFDPFRRADSLNFVIQGINAGAVGVKFYPPSGYSATNNKIDAEDPAASASAHKRWDSRYKNLSPAQLDAFNEKLFDYCEKPDHDTPIFTHCTPGGFEAEKGYGAKADPAEWERVLEKHKELRLCFGHSGGDDFWFPDPASGNTQSYGFGRKVVELCRKYHNVYCEVGYLERILDRDGAKKFSARLSELLKEPVPAGQWALADKIMYGTDWHMIYKEHNHAFYFDEFRNVLSEPSLKKYQRRFFSGNAIAFLNLAKLSDDNKRFAKSQRDYWKSIIAKNAPATPASQ